MPATRITYEEYKQLYPGSQIIHVKKILIDEGRQRQEFSAKPLGDLSDGIQARGLLHAIVLREVEGGLKLVAGERRIRACLYIWIKGMPILYNGVALPEGYLPYSTMGQLSALEAEEAELEENLHREGLTWQEQATAMDKLHRLRGKQAQAEGRVHTVADTALEVRGRSDGSYQDTVRKDLIVAKHLNNPEVAKAKSADEAFKILKRQENTRNNIALSESVGKSFTSKIHIAENVDCLDWMRCCDEGTFDVILTDPPYGMDADKFGDGGSGRLSNNTHEYKDDIHSWRALMLEWCPLAFKVAKAQAHAYVFCDLDNYHELKKMMQGAGWYVFRTPMIAVKPNSGRVPLPDEGPRRQYEVILYAIKGHKKTTAIYPDVITTMADPGMQHGAQKPVALYENLLQRSVRPGDVVLDSFSGSGTIFPAADRFQCKAVGLEKSMEYFGMGLTRLKEMNTPVSASAIATGSALSAELKNMFAKAGPAFL